MTRLEKVRRRLKAAKDRERTSRQVELKQGGVYALPNGMELVAGVGRAGRYFLYHPLVWAGQAWIVTLPITCEVDAEGRVLSHKGSPTGWRVGDLTDLHRTVERQSSRL